MKIGILTFHRCINYGSYWQTRCLAEGLQKMGHQVQVLDHHSCKVNIAEWKCALQPVLPIPVAETDHSLYRQKINKFFDAFKSLPLSGRFPLEDPSQSGSYDMVVVGSDEVWNLSHPWYGHYPIFYGEGIKSMRLISYAASFGNYNSSWKLDQQFIEKLSRFEKISVRDENSQFIIKNALGIEPQVVLDPCLQFSLSFKTNNADVKGPYAVVYGHNFSDSLIAKIRKWSFEKKLPLFSVGYRNDWVDKQCITAGPEEFVTLIEHSKTVITNFFHGCIFALLYSKPFICETSLYRGNKIQDLMKIIGSENRFIHENSTDEMDLALATEPLDGKILQNITNLRQSSEDWLKKAIQ